MSGGHAYGGGWGWTQESEPTLVNGMKSLRGFADVAVVKLWWMPPTLRGVTGASSRWSMKLGASHGSGSGCLRPCSRRGARVS